MQTLGAWLLAVAVVAAGECTDVLKVNLEASAPGKGTEGRTAAIEKARTEAVLQVVQNVTASDDILLFRPILDRANEYVQSCRVLEQTEKDGTTQVKVEAYILYKQLKTDLATTVLPLFPRPPRVVVAVVESGVEGESKSAKTVVERLTETLKESGLEVVEAAQVRSRCSASEAQARVKGDADSAVRYAWENTADVAIVGELTVEVVPGAEGSNLTQSRALAVLRIIRGDDARTFEVQSDEAVVNSRILEEGREMAVSDVCDKVKGPVLVSTVLAAAGAKATPYVVVTVEGLRNESQMDELVARAKQCPGVQDAQALHFAADASRLRVRYDGPVGPLVDMLTEEKYSGFKLDPRQVIDRDMTLAVAQ